MRPQTSMHLARTAFVALAVLAGTDVLATPFPPCPAEAKNDFALFVGARTDSFPCECNTVITCTNLSKNESQVALEFYNALASSYQGGVSVLIPSGQGRTLGMSSDSPLGIRPPWVSAGIDGSVAATARVCSASKKLACTGIIECACGGSTPGPVVVPLQAVLKKQKGA